MMHNNIETNAKNLKLAYIKANFKEIIKEAIHTDMNCEEFLNLLLENEVNARKKSSIRNKMRAAKFSEIRYLDDYDITVFNKEIQKSIKVLKDLSFVNRKGQAPFFSRKPHI